MIKELIKSLMGKFMCIRFRLNAHKNVYIGSHSKIIGGQKIVIEQDVQIRPYAFIVCDDGGIIKIGEKSDLGERVRIACSKSIKIGSNVLFGPNIYIADRDHRYDMIGIPVMNQGIVIKTNQSVINEGIEIGEGAWLGINVVVVGNVYIGKGSVIGANSVVTKDVPDYCVAVGSPCKIIKKFNFETNLWEKIIR